MQNMFIWYPASKFKDQNGETAPIDFDLDLLLTRNKKGKEVGEGILLYASQVKIENGALEID